MQQWRVSDVMTTDVVTAPLDTSVGKLVDIMSTNRISAVPVVGGDRVVGIVSQADLLPRVAALYSSVPALIGSLDGVAACSPARFAVNERAVDPAAVGGQSLTAGSSPVRLSSVS
jgi:CBS domain containing-hemolysin-like protein